MTMRVVWIAVVFWMAIAPCLAQPSNMLVQPGKYQPLPSIGQVTVASPTAPGSTSAYTMQGLGLSVTPTFSNQMQIVISGTIIAPAGTTVDNGINYQISFGTGGNPVNAIATTAASGTGTVATLTFSGTTVIPVGSSIIVASVTPSGYNTAGATVTASSAGSVSYANTTTGAQTGAGTITSALTGTQVGAIQTWTLPVAATAAADVHTPFCITAIVTATTTGSTTYWVDLAAESVTTASGMALSNVNATAEEIQ